MKGFVMKKWIVCASFVVAFGCASEASVDVEIEDESCEMDAGVDATDPVSADPNKPPMDGGID